MKLDGVKVLDLSQFLPGPTVTQMMSDHGAEVIKIESVGVGEPTRDIGQRRDGRSVYFDCTQRGKKSITLNLKSSEGQSAFLRLAASADVVSSLLDREWRSVWVWIIPASKLLRMTLFMHPYRLLANRDLWNKIQHPI